MAEAGEVRYTPDGIATLEFAARIHAAFNVSEPAAQRMWDAHATIACIRPRGLREYHELVRWSHRDHDRSPSCMRRWK